ncbi:heparin lyase I family protein [Rhizobium leguminosarum]
MRRLWTPLLLAALAGCNHTVREDFASEPSGKNWFVCHRPENTFRFGNVDPTQKTAMVATVKPEPRTFALRKEGHASCQDEQGDYKRDGKERAEIWEARHRWLHFGTDVWYRFDMYVDDRLEPTAKRLVAGQWKEEAGARDGPLLAQRFTGKRFTITVEQDNFGSKGKPDDTLCRVLVADQLPLSESPAGWPHDDNAEDLPPRRFLISAPKAIAEDTTEATDRGCARDIVPLQYHPLPNPFGHWTTMVFHLRLTPENGLVEIWADGVKISKTTGRIGYAKPGERGAQFFKFGPYRDPEHFETAMMLANYVRSTSRKEVDPTGKLAPELAVR